MNNRKPKQSKYTVTLVATPAEFTIKKRSVIAVNLKTGKQTFYKILLDVKFDGFSPSAVSQCCQGKYGKKKNVHKGHAFDYIDKSNPLYLFWEAVKETKPPLPPLPNAVKETKPPLPPLPNAN